MKKGNIIYACVCIIMSLLFIFWLIPAYTSKSVVRGDIPSSAIPKALMYVILFFGVIILIEALFQKTDTSEKANAGEWVKLLIVLGVLLMYILAIKYIGFYVSTLIALPAALKYFNKDMKWGTIAISSIVMLAVVYFLFEKGLTVKMPRGFLL